MSTPKFLKLLTLSRLSNNMFIGIILFLPSCADMTMREYNYVETSTHTYYDSTSPKEQRPFLIKAKSDSDAYLKAYLNFCIAQKYYNKEFQKSGTKAGKPLSFRLLNEDSIDIAKSVSFMTKKELENRIEKKVALFELQKDNGN